MPRALREIHDNARLGGDVRVRAGAESMLHTAQAGREGFEAAAASMARVRRAPVVRHDRTIQLAATRRRREVGPLRWDFMALRLQKATAAIVIAIGLGAQMYAILRPSDAWLWPFVDYPMYSAPHHVGDMVRGRTLVAIGCGEQPATWRLPLHALGYQGAWLHRQLRGIARQSPAAARSRAEIAHAVSRYARPRPCALEIWERTITVTPDGVDAASFEQVPAQRLVRWSVNDPAAVTDIRPVEDTP